MFSRGEIMNQAKVGKFIAECRKKKNLTQQELADELGITDRAVSHWENGRSLPDISLFKQLCDILNISINELICGERISEDKLAKKSDENIINTLEDKIKQKKKANSIIIALVLGIIFLFIALLLSTRITYPKINLFHFTIQSSSSDAIYELHKQLNIDQRNVYYYGIDFALFCDEKENCYQVDEALKHRQMSIDKFQKYLDKQVEYENYRLMQFWDGGTKVYEKSGMIVMFCNTIEGNRDVYIGNDTMLNNLQGEYCGHSKNEDKSYIRTYKVISTTINSADEEFNDVILQQNDGTRGTVLINNSYSLIPGHTYEFSFLTFDHFTDTIENIFNHSTFLTAVETLKEPTEQINEKIIVNDDLDNGSELNELEHVKMDIVNGTVTSTSARVRITDLTNGKYSYGSDFRIDKKDGDKWVELKPKEPLLFTDIAYGPDRNGYIELDINWERSYGKLDKGRYRIVKSALMNSEIPCENECKNYYFSVEFDID